MTPNNQAPAPVDVIEQQDYNQLVYFKRHHVQPPGNEYITLDDICVVRAFAPITDTTVRVSWRILTPLGRIDRRFEEFTATANGAAPTIKTFRNMEGFILSVSVETPGAPIGQCYVMVTLQYGAGSQDHTQGAVLIGGYPGTATAIAFPTTPVRSPLDGLGRIRTVAVTQPAAGAEWTEVVPAGVKWKVLSITFTLTTSGAAPLRDVNINTLDGGGLIAFSSAIQSALNGGVAWLFTLFPALAVATTHADVMLPIATEYWVNPGWTFTSVTRALDAADQYSNIVITVREFANA